MSEGMAWGQVRSDAAQLNREMDEAIAGLEDMRSIVAGRPPRRARVENSTSKADTDAMSMSIPKDEQPAGGDLRKEGGTFSNVLHRYQIEEESGARNLAAADNTSAPSIMAELHASSERRPREAGGTYSSVLRRYEQAEVAERKSTEGRRHSEAEISAVLQKYSGKQVRHGGRARSSDQSSVRPSMAVSLDKGSMRRAETHVHRKDRPVFDLPNEVKPLPKSKPTHKMLGRRTHASVGKELYRPDIYN